MTLVERLCAAEGPDRGLDAMIAAVTGFAGWSIEEWQRAIANMPRDPLSPPVMSGCPTYTASLDAAMTLVPNGHEWLRKDPGVMTVYRVPTDDKEWARHIEAAGATPALALCIAALRARESA